MLPATPEIKAYLRTASHWQIFLSRRLLLSSLGLVLLLSGWSLTGLTGMWPVTICMPRS